MTTPFQNDPMCFVWMAFQRLFPDKKCVVSYDAGVKDIDGTRVYGLTTFCDDGSIYVTIDAGMTVCHAVETLAHELAHVAVGAEIGHGPEWEKAFDAIYDEYIKIGDEICPDSEYKTVEIIGDTVQIKDGGETNADGETPLSAEMKNELRPVQADIDDAYYEYGRKRREGRTDD